MKNEAFIVPLRKHKGNRVEYTLVESYVLLSIQITIGPLSKNQETGSHFFGSDIFYVNVKIFVFKCRPS